MRLRKMQCKQIESRNRMLQCVGERGAKIDSFEGINRARARERRRVCVLSRMS